MPGLEQIKMEENTMTKTEFLEKMEEGVRLAKKANFANTQLTDQDAEKAFAELDAFAEDCIGTFAAPVDYIKNMFQWASNNIRF